MCFSTLILSVTPNPDLHGLFGAILLDIESFSQTAVSTINLPVGSLSIFYSTQPNTKVLHFLPLGYEIITCHARLAMIVYVNINVLNIILNSHLITSLNCQKTDSK